MMVSETMVIAGLNILVGILILAIKGSIRFIVGGYFLLSGILMILIPLMN